MTPRGRDSALDVGVVLFQGLKSTWLLFTYVNWMSQMQRHLQWPHCLRRHGELIRHSDSVFNRLSHPWILESWGVENPDEAESLRACWECHNTKTPANGSNTTRTNPNWDLHCGDQTPCEGVIYCRSVLLKWWVVIQKCGKASRNPWELNFNVQFKGLDHCEWKGWQDNSSVPSRLGTF